MIGKINIASNSNIGGLQITENSIKSSNGNIVLESNGNAKIGALNIDGTNARFDGTIRADRIEGQLTGNQIYSNAITGGHIDSRTIWGGNIRKDAVGIEEVNRNKDLNGLDNFYATRVYCNELYAQKAEIKNLLAKNGTFTGKCSWTGRQFKKWRYSATIENDDKIGDKGLLIQNSFGDVTIKVPKHEQNGPRIVLDGDVIITGEIYRFDDRSFNI